MNIHSRTIYFNVLSFNVRDIINNLISGVISRWGSGKESACQCRRHRRCSFNPWVRKDLLEEKIATTHSSIPAWRIPWTRSLEGYSPQGCKDSDRTKGLGTNKCTHTKHSNDTPSESQIPNKTHISS